MSERPTCWRCKAEMSGSGICRACHARNLVPNAAAVFKPKREMTTTPKAPSFEEMLEIMERHWRAASERKRTEKGSVAVGLRFKVFQRDGFTCRYCGRSLKNGIILHADHVVPQSKGGATTFDNLVTACSDCNIGKSDRLLVV